MKPIKTNYHTHHELCGHAKGTAEDYVVSAIDKGFEVLGFSDHAPSDLLYNPKVRMRHSDLETYIDDVLKQKNRYKDEITVHLGLEVEYIEEDSNYYTYLKSKVDYLILGQHYVKRPDLKKIYLSAFTLKAPSDILQYAKSVEAALHSGHYSLLAHPDLYMCSYPSFDEYAKQAAHIIIDAAIATNVPLEINAQGIRKGIITTKDGAHYKYPRKEFFEIARTKGATFMISSDVHDPDMIDDESWEAAKRFADELNLDIIEHLPGLDT